MRGGGGEVLESRMVWGGEGGEGGREGECEYRARGGTGWM